MEESGVFDVPLDILETWNLKHDISRPLELEDRGVFDDLSQVIQTWNKKLDIGHNLYIHFLIFVFHGTTICLHHSLKMCFKLFWNEFYAILSIFRHSYLSWGFQNFPWKLNLPRLGWFKEAFKNDLQKTFNFPFVGGGV